MMPRDSERLCRDPNTLKAQYLENSWMCYLATIADYYAVMHVRSSVGSILAMASCLMSAIVRQWCITVSVDGCQPTAYRLNTDKTGPWTDQETAFLATAIVLDWIVQCFTSPPTQYRLYGRRFLQVKRPNQQYQSTEGTNSTHSLRALYNSTSRRRLHVCPWRCPFAWCNLIRPPSRLTCFRHQRVEFLRVEGDRCVDI